MIFFITSAFADGATQQSSGWMQFLPMIAFIGILYFLLIRPQQKKQKQHQALVSSITKGDKVITNSGIIATVSKILNDQEVILEIAEGVHCKFIKSTIASVFNKETEKVTNKTSPVDSQKIDSPISNQSEKKDKRPSASKKVVKK